MNALRNTATIILKLTFATLLVTLAGEVAAQTPAGPMPLLTSRVDPNEFGTQDETRTVISATSFLPGKKGQLNIVPYSAYYTSPSLGRYAEHHDLNEFYATLDLPAGALVDFIGVNSTTDTNGVLGVALWRRDRFANMSLLAGFSLPAHGWDTDFAGPLGILVTDHVDNELVLNVEQEPNLNYQFFGWVEVWWHRTVSPPPATASFGDVPTSHPFFQFIEALKASGITGGCGNGTTFCPDSPLTRGQMAVFLAKALGLHWPN